MRNIQTNTIKNSVRMTKALADFGRMRIVAALMSRGELCVCQITALLGLATSSVSRHLSLLQNAHLIDARRDGRWIYYRLSDEFPSELERWFKNDALKTQEVQEDLEKLDSLLRRDPEELCRRERGEK